MIDLNFWESIARSWIKGRNQEEIANILETITKRVEQEICGRNKLPSILDQALMMDEDEADE